MTKARSIQAHLWEAFSLLLLITATLFISLPIVAIVMRTSMSVLMEQISSPVFVDALIVSVVSSLVAHLVIIIVGTPVAYLLATRNFSGRGALISLLELPIVLPPAVAGIGLLSVFGRRGMLGSYLESVGINIPFTLVAVVMAVVFVAGPFYLHHAIAAFKEVDTGYIEAARTLGASPVMVFFRIATPLAATGIAAGSTLSLARGFGEFGATIMFAGSIQGKTETLPLAVYSQMDVNFDGAIALAAILISIGVALLAMNKGVMKWATSRFS